MGRTVGGELENLIEIRKREPRDSDYVVERKVATYLSEGFAGEGFHRVGSKQARNILQILGLTRFEIPLDSHHHEMVKPISNFLTTSLAPGSVTQSIITLLWILFRIAVQRPIFSLVFSMPQYSQATTRIGPKATLTQFSDQLRRI